MPFYRITYSQKQYHSIGNRQKMTKFATFPTLKQLFYEKWKNRFLKNYFV